MPAPLSHVMARRCKRMAAWPNKPVVMQRGLRTCPGLWYSSAPASLLPPSFASNTGHKRCHGAPQAVHNLTLEQKAALVKEAEKGSTVKPTTVKEFGIPLFTLSTVLTKKEKVPDGLQWSLSNKQKRCRTFKVSGRESCPAVVAAKREVANPLVTGSMMEKANDYSADGVHRSLLEQQMV